jgi:hypothetical protein
MKSDMTDVSSRAKSSGSPLRLLTAISSIPHLQDHLARVYVIRIPFQLSSASSSPLGLSRY